ncbi:non-structural protein 1 [Cherax quadricarinatus densovirus]|uniref:Non-structural protein 1 n=1 Tax=Cherax quadricarinatus densovirus TaxID=1642018 RepID=A0A0E3TUS3_9VIRU|nr:non-structural protein 1 [Cherax quadricarinatus densovirus]AKC42760.1 non-structural protein 1 [Cherax quadricarinatus densovirus]
MNNVQEEAGRDVTRTRNGGRGGLGTRKRRRSDSGERRNDSGTEDIVHSDVAENTTGELTVEPSTSGLSTGIRDDDDGRDQSTSRTRELPVWFSKSGPDMEQRYWKGFKERCDRILTELQNSDGQLVRDIFRFEDPREYDDFIRCIQRDTNYRRGLLQVCREDSHIHVVHDCTFSNGMCRCDWYKKAKTYGAHLRRDKRSHRRNSCRSRTATDIQNLLFYYCTKGRQIVYQKIRGQLERIPSEGYNLSTSRLNGLSEYFREMALQIPGDGPELQQWEPDLEVDEPAEVPTNGVPQRKKRKMGAQERIQLKTVELLELYPICPPEAIVKHRIWRCDPELRFKNVNDKEIRNAISSFKDTLTTYSMNEYQKMYNNPDCIPIFSAGYGNYETYYYNVENSLKIMDELVNYQCGGDEEAIIDFVTTLYNVLERKVPKLNCIVIHSPPSAGKNFFFDAVKDYYLNCGHLCNANKYNNFPFQDAEGRRIVLWNEPNYAPEFLEQIKEILGGDSTSVNVKYQSDTPVYRTPVIVLTNNKVSFMNHSAFIDRIRVFNWMAAPFLAQYKKKPNPLAVYDFFKKYKLVEG